MVFSQPIQHAIEQAATDANVDISHWTPARIRGIWSRTAKDWNKRATDAGVLWGTKPGTQTRSAEISTKIQTIDGDFLSCRPLERTNSSPCLLPTLPEQVFILTVASETMVTRNGKIQVYVDGPLSLNLKISERLVRACIFSSFQRPASIFPALNHVQICQFLLPPMSLLLSQDRFLDDPAAYNASWPDQSIRPVLDSVSLQNLFDGGNNNTDTLVLLAHHAYNHFGWIGWAKQMRNMSPNSSFGMGFVYVIIPLVYFSLTTFSLSADRDVVFQRDRSLYGRDSLDYIIAIPNRALQSLAIYLSTRAGNGSVYFSICQ